MNKATRMFVFDRETGSMHEVGTDTHDTLTVNENGIQYYNLQNGEGTLPSGKGTYVFLKSDAGDLCEWCCYNIYGFVGHPHCNGCDGASEFEIKPQIKEQLMNKKVLSKGAIIDVSYQR